MNRPVNKTDFENAKFFPAGATSTMFAMINMHSRKDLEDGSIEFEAQQILSGHKRGSKFKMVMPPLRAELYKNGDTAKFMDYQIEQFPDNLELFVELVGAFKNLDQINHASSPDDAFYAAQWTVGDEATYIFFHEETEGFSCGPMEF